MPASVDRRPRPLSLLGHRVHPRIDLVTVVRLGIVAGTVVAAVLAVRAFGRPYDFFDLRIYHGAVVWWAKGGELYQYIAPQTTLGFTYPPFAAVAMLPMAVLSTPTAAWFNTIGSLAVLAAVLFVLVGPIAQRHGWPRWFATALAVPLAAATEPVRETLGYGQVNLLLAGLVVMDLVALRRRAGTAAYRAVAAVRRRTGAGRAATTVPLAEPVSSTVSGTVAGPAGERGRSHPPVDRPASGTVTAGGSDFPPLVWLRRGWQVGAFSGVGVGLATAIKLTPALFILYFVISRQWRAAVTATGTALAVTAATFVVAGRESSTYFGDVVWDTNRIGAVDATPNQSLAGVLARLYDSPVTPGLMWLSFALLLLAVGLSRAVSAHAEGDEMTAFTLVALTANAICPISWSHHLVFVVPAVLILADSALRRRSAVRGLGIGRHPTLAGLRHALCAVGLFVLFVVSPIWPYEHKLSEGVSHYANGLPGALWENSLALAVIVLIVLLPWRPGAEPAFDVDSGPARRRRLMDS
jgi:alpha-1,2-mannosyltransferase